MLQPCFYGIRKVFWWLTFCKRVKQSIRNTIWNCYVIKREKKVKINIWGKLQKRVFFFSLTRHQNYFFKELKNLRNNAPGFLTLQWTSYKFYVFRSLPSLWGLNLFSAPYITTFSYTYLASSHNFNIYSLNQANIFFFKC